MTILFVIILIIIQFLIIKRINIVEKKIKLHWEIMREDIININKRINIKEADCEKCRNDRRMG